MLNSIKAMINEKQSFLAEAATIFEDGIGNLDDSIVLGESTELPESFMEEESIEDNDESLDNEGEENIDNDEQSEDEDTSNDDLLSGSVEEEEPEEDTSNDPDSLLDIPVDDEGGLEGPVEEPAPENNDLLGGTMDDPLPTPVGNQTGEPVTDQIDNLLDTTIDLQTNTVKDSLPIPPANAAEALPDDTMSTQKVDSGFGGDSSPITPVENNTPPVSEESEADINTSDTPGDATIDMSMESVMKTIENKYNDYVEECKAMGIDASPLTVFIYESGLNTLIESCNKNKSCSECSDGTDSCKEKNKREADENKWKKIFEKANILVSADGEKGYHLEDVPYILYCASCANKNKKPVSKKEFNSNEKFGKIKKDVYDKLSSMIKSNKFSVVCESVEELYTNSELMSFTEGITLGDESSDTSSNEETSTEEVPDGAAPENDVTAAVRDKVEESEEVNTDGLEDFDTEESDSDSKSKMEDIMKKLSDVTKRIEDIKNTAIKI